MVRQKWIRWAEPLFPVLIIAAGVCLAPAFLMGGNEKPAAATSTSRYIGTPVVVEDRYVGCEIAGNVYDPAVAPIWQCGHDSFALGPTTAMTRDIASLPAN